MAFIRPLDCSHIRKMHAINKRLNKMIQVQINKGSYTSAPRCRYRGYYISVHALLFSLNDVRIRDKMRGLSSVLSLFLNEFNEFNRTRARMLDSIYHTTIILL